MSVFSRLVLPLVAFLLLCSSSRAGWSFDTNLTPEVARDLLAAPGFPAAPAGSWLRVRDLASSMVRDSGGAETVPWSGAQPSASLAERRTALIALRAQGYRLVAMIRWPADSWAGGVRPDQPLRRLPLDLRNAADRCRQLAAAYGDLIDYWEIENEPDISFVEENPETYGAFLKACYLGFKGRPADDRGPGTGHESFPTKTQRGHSSVLMAGLALPPGPYFAAWVANDGLRYTDGFNYHYYGYAEDFTGVYDQFHVAIAETPPPTPIGTAVFQTQFYPASEDWEARVLSQFAASEGDAQSHRDLLQSRPLATEEPALKAHDRWLVSPGMSVRETRDGWEFSVNAPAPGPLRPAVAELPLPERWAGGPNASLAFEYRTGRALLAQGETDGAKRFASPPAVPRPQSSVVEYPKTSLPSPTSSPRSRRLP